MFTNSSIPYPDNSLPNPLFFIPPKGTRGPETTILLTVTIPDLTIDDNICTKRRRRNIWERSRDNGLSMLRNFDKCSYSCVIIPFYISNSTDVSGFSYDLIGILQSYLKFTNSIDYIEMISFYLCSYIKKIVISKWHRDAFNLFVFCQNISSFSYLMRRSRLYFPSIREKVGSIERLVE